MSCAWAVERLVDSVAAVHAREALADRPPTVWVVEPTDRSIVLGSSQPASHVDAEAAARLGVAVTRRRSGGGAVLVTPASMVWVDVIVPRTHASWSDDIGRASVWMGERWAQALATLGVVGAVVQPPMVADDLGRVVCFVGRGPGEVLVDGAKAVGVAQRRTRDTARFQCAALLRWEADLLLDVLTPLSETDRERVRCAGVGLPVSADALVDALVDALD